MDTVKEIYKQKKKLLKDTEDLKNKFNVRKPILGNLERKFFICTI